MPIEDWALVAPGDPRKTLAIPFPIEFKALPRYGTPTCRTYWLIEQWLLKSRYNRGHLA